MGRAVFLNISGGGHVIATYGLVAELIQRGEEVFYFEVPHFRDDIEALGATFCPMPPVNHYSGPLYGDRFHHEVDLATIMTWYALELVPVLLEEIRALKPDYIIHDALCSWGKILAELLDVPGISSSHAPALTLEAILSDPQIWQHFPDMNTKALDSLKGLRRTERLLRTRFHLKPRSFIEALSNPQPVNICHAPRELQPYGEQFDGTYHFIASVHERPNQAKSSFDMNKLDDKILYIGFGTICDPGPQFFRNCLLAFKDIGMQVVMILSHSTLPEDLGDIPDNFLVWSLKRDGMAPQLDILPRAQLFVMNGGMGGAREGAWNGVPLLAIPTTWETDMISRRIEAQGAGLRLPVDASPERLRQYAQSILREPSFQVNSRRIGDACREAGGARRGADIILNHVASHRHSVAQPAGVL